MGDQILDGSDNACSYDLEIPNSQNNAPLSTDLNANGAGIASDLEKQLQIITQQSNKMTNDDTNEYNIVESIMMEKVQLLVDLTHPINSKLDILTKFEKMQKKLLQQFNQLLNSSTEYLKEYAAHCDQAVVTANDALESNTEFDQYVHMDFEALLSQTKNMDIQRKELLGATAEMRDRLKEKECQYQKEYTSVRNESQIFQRYEMEALETLEQIKFDVQRRRRKFAFNN